MSQRKKSIDPMRVRERASFSYTVAENTPDLKEQIQRLANIEDSPYWGRSMADIAGMILKKTVQNEIKKYTNK